MNAKPLLSEQPVTTQNHRPSAELIEVIQRLVRLVNAQQAINADLTARIEALETP